MSSLPGVIGRLRVLRDPYEQVGDAAGAHAERCAAEEIQWRMGAHIHAPDADDYHQGGRHSPQAPAQVRCDHHRQSGGNGDVAGGEPKTAGGEDFAGVDVSDQRLGPPTLYELL